MPDEDAAAALLAEVDQFVDVVEGEGAAAPSVGWGYILRRGRRPTLVVLSVG